MNKFRFRLMVAERRLLIPVAYLMIALRETEQGRPSPTSRQEFLEMLHLDTSKRDKLTFIERLMAVTPDPKEKAPKSIKPSPVSRRIVEKIDRLSAAITEGQANPFQRALGEDLVAVALAHHMREGNCVSVISALLDADSGLVSFDMKIRVVARKPWMSALTFLDRGLSRYLEGGFHSDLAQMRL